LWVGAALALMLGLLRLGNRYLPDAIPCIPLNWNFGQCFTDEPWCYLPGFIYCGRLIFFFVAVAFFAPTRVSFSIWFIGLAYAFYTVIVSAYLPPFPIGAVDSQRSGTMILMTLVILWLGRERWLQIARSLLSRGRENGTQRDRVAGLMFLLGMAGMFTWFLWAGAQPGWALLFIVIGFSVCLVISRVVAETGAGMRIYGDCSASTFMAMAPVAWVGAASAFLSGVANAFFQTGSAVNGTVMVTHALALDEQRSAREESWMGGLFAGILVLGLVVCGAALIYYTYHHSVTLDGVESPIHAWGMGGFAEATHMLRAQQQGMFTLSSHKPLTHMGIGAAVTLALQWACVVLPKWPIHPIGMLLVYTWWGTVMWGSVLIGWMVKVLLVRFGGSAVYRSAKPFFLGLVIGEVLTIVLVEIVAFAMFAAGKTYTQ
jgi:hypothetical protein